MSLRQDVLRSLTLTELAIERKQALSTRNSDEDSDDELIYVVSVLHHSHSARSLRLRKTSTPGTPSRSRAPSRPSSRPVSPTRRATPRNAPSATPASKSLSSDPLKAFPTQISQRVFRWLSILDLASCSRVSRKWNKSQTLNYSVWCRVFVLRVLTLTSMVSTLSKRAFSGRELAPGQVD